MTKEQIVNKVTRTANRFGMKIKKHSPEILLVTGIVGTVTSAVMACKATTKIDFILEDTKDKVDIIHAGVENGEVMGKLDDGEIGLVPYSEQDGKKDLAVVYAQAGIQFAKLYGPSVILGAASIGCILASHNIIRKRNVALAAAYATIDSSFKEYRNRVVSRFGKELDRELKYNIKAQEIEKTISNEDGSETTVTETVNTVEPNLNSDYARFFDECSPYWEKDAEYNLMFLKRQQDYANELLKAKGYLFLNEVYEMLGIQKTRAGQIVGWTYDPYNNVDGDNYIDFGIYDVHDKQKRLFVNGHERSILLDFNVDGNIWELLH